VVVLTCMTPSRIDWVAEHCQLLRAISAEFTGTLPFQGLTIGTGIHLEAKTVALLLTLRAGGARLVCTGNLNTTQPDAIQALEAEGVTVIGGPTKDRQRHYLEAPYATGGVDASSCVVPVPARIDAAIAGSYLNRKYPRA
jgi:S-adenosylhomocysteine hydrolase